MKKVCPTVSIAKRARSDAQKALREQQILDAAADLIHKQRFQAVALVDVAKQVGITKAALYRYFRSKEQLFLALYQREFEQLAARLESVSDDALFTSFVEALLAQPLFCQLSAILHTVLEAGLDVGEAKAFKQFLLARMSVTAKRLERISGRDGDSCFAFLLRCQQALIGCWHSSHPTEQMAQVIAEPPLTAFKRDFAQILHVHLSILYRDFLA